MYAQHSEFKVTVLLMKTLSNKINLFTVSVALMLINPFVYDIPSMKHTNTV